ncbi:unnamed protein product [Nippostrongylus brasiliensis]|uniref:Uncharacterized protein n=1 Tax=Nippostrongylus brasiliensis TaxID=27835 RepID=A0A0N4XGW1_NIPBR|nr:unnamed protein product [Nippostrongylus brasiliensis]
MLKAISNTESGHYSFLSNTNHIHEKVASAPVYSLSISCSTTIVPTQSGSLVATTLDYTVNIEILQLNPPEMDPPTEIH